MLDLTFRKPGAADQPTAAAVAIPGASPPSAGPAGVPPVAGASPRPAVPGGASGIQGLHPAAVSEDRTIATAALVGVSIVAVTGLIASFLVAQNRGAADRRAEQVTELQAQLKTGEVAAAVTQVETVNRQINIFQSFLKDAVPWPELLTVFGKLVPGSLKLTSAGFTGQKVLRLDGEAKDYQTVATFVATLRASGSFPNPQISSVSLNESTTGTTLTFALSVGFVPKPSDASRQPASPAGGTPVDTGTEASATTEARDAE